MILHHQGPIWMDPLVRFTCRSYSETSARDADTKMHSSIVYRVIRVCVWLGHVIQLCLTLAFH